MCNTGGERIGYCFPVQKQVSSLVDFVYTADISSCCLSDSDRPVFDPAKFLFCICNLTN